MQELEAAAQECKDHAPVTTTWTNPPLPRSSGILLHVSSLPGPYGVGDFGPTAFEWVDTLAAAHQMWWQTLPLGPTGQGHAPYNSQSAFALNPDFISPDRLVEDGLLQRADLSPPHFPADRVAYELVGPFKAGLLTRAWENFHGGTATQLKDDFEEFCHIESHWLDDFSLFLTLRDLYGGHPWIRWDRDAAFGKPRVLREIRNTRRDDIKRHQFSQFLLLRQMEAIRRYTHDKGVKVIGDLPMFVSADSADVWANPRLFQLDSRHRPKAVAGVPPDYFSRTGQRWGNPLYDWDIMRREHFAWWIRRVRSELRFADLLRIDHFRGFDGYWRIPARSRTARSGRWAKAPGAELLATLRDALGGSPFIAEDLGLITPQVEKLRDDFGLPGMRVLQFAFGSDANNPFLPHNYVRNTVVYTGTHDNDTTAGWYRMLDAKQQAAVKQYLHCADEDIAWDLIRLAWSSVAQIAIAPLQDVLGLGSEARMNTPGTATGNWRWRMRGDALRHDLVQALADLTRLYGRASSSSAA